MARQVFDEHLIVTVLLEELPQIAWLNEVLIRDLAREGLDLPHPLLSLQILGALSNLAEGGADYNNVSV
jgi:hypothetical protein